MSTPSFSPLYIASSPSSSPHSSSINNTDLSSCSIGSLSSHEHIPHEALTEPGVLLSPTNISYHHLLSTDVEEKCHSFPMLDFQTSYAEDLTGLLSVPELERRKQQSNMMVQLRQSMCQQTLQPNNMNGLECSLMPFTPSPSYAKSMDDESTFCAEEKQQHTTKAKRFLCNQCGKAVSTRGSLTLHLKTHQGVKPFPCTLCGRSFTQSGNLRRHERNVHHLGSSRQASNSDDSESSSNSEC